MTDEYVALTNEAKEKIALRKEIRKFRADERTSEYRHTRATLGLTSLCYKYAIRRLLADRRLIRQGRTPAAREKAIWYQFDTCSYWELSSCIKARIQWIREMASLLENTQISEDYKLVVLTVKQRITNDQNEIVKLLKMRRVLKKSGLRSWDSNVLAVG